MQRPAYRDARWLYECLLAQHGPRRWWPARTQFEMMVGAVLTQNAAWRNVEQAIADLRAARLLDARKIVKASSARLARVLRPAGCFNVKTRRLKAYCSWYLDQGGYAVLARSPTHALRSALLSVSGIGPETADDILVYAFSRPVFVVDAYTRRLFARLGFIQGDESYTDIQQSTQAALGAQPRVFNEMHALIVTHCKDVCRKAPRCDACCLRARCKMSITGG